MHRYIKGNGGQSIIVQADVSQEADVKKLLDACIEAYGHLDIMIANAGLQQDAAFTEMSLKQWNTVINVNLTGQFLVCREAARLFKEQGVHSHGAAAGKIICMSSVHDEIPWAGHVNYATAKGGVKMLMEIDGAGVGPLQDPRQLHLSRCHPNGHQQRRLGKCRRPRETTYPYPLWPYRAGGRTLPMS